MTKEELLARMQASDNNAPAAGGEERANAGTAGFTKLMSTATAGGTDYLDLMVRRARGEDIDIDRLRDKYRRDYEASPTTSMIGGFAGSAAQALPIGRGMQAVGLLGKMAPGIWGGIKSGAALGTGVGTVNEAARQLDRLGSQRSADEEFSIPGSAFRVGKDIVAGGVGGALGGVVGNLATQGKGMLANMRGPIPEPVIGAAMREADEAAKLGIAGPGKLGPEEALRAIRDPALRHQAADAAAAFEGRMAQAGKGYTGNELPKEISRNQFRQGLQSRVGREAAEATNVAGRVAADAAAAQTNLAASREALRGTPLDIPAFHALHNDPALKAVTKQLLDAQRTQLVGKLQGNPRLEYNKADAMKAARSRYPSNTYGGVERAAAQDPTVAASADRILRMQNPAFQAADDAAAALARAEFNAMGRQAHQTDLGRVINSTGRLVAQKPPSVGADLPTLSPTKWVLQAAKAGHAYWPATPSRNRLIG